MSLCFLTRETLYPGTSVRCSKDRLWAVLLVWCQFDRLSMQEWVQESFLTLLGGNVDGTGAFVLVASSVLLLLPSHLLILFFLIIHTSIIIPNREYLSLLCYLSLTCYSWMRVAVFPLHYLMEEHIPYWNLHSSISETESLLYPF